MRFAEYLLLLATILFGANPFSIAMAAETATAAQGSTPATIVAALYEQDSRHHSPFFQTDDRAAVDAYFEKALADLIWNDAITADGEVGALEASPLYDAQDEEITHLTIGPVVSKDGKDEVAVSFENFGEKKLISYELVRKGTEWRITDIRYPDGRTLRTMLKP